MVKRHPRVRLRGETLEDRRLLAFNSLVITEFMAANVSVLADDDGDFSDWIELYNPTDQPMPLKGWSLTDDAERLDKWPLPDATLSSNEYLLVYASGKDRRLIDQPLHTNFRLDAEGEFLGLVDPAGSLTHSFGDAFPPQRNDIAYGLPIEQHPLVSSSDAARWLVPQPADALLEDRWKVSQFDDASWSSSTGTLGYDLTAGLPNVGFEAGDLSDWSSSGQARAVTATIGTAPTQGQWQSFLLADATSTTRFSLETFLGLSRSALNRVGDVSVRRGTAVRRSMVVEAGSEFQVDWNFLTDEPSLNGNEDFAFVSISPGNQVIRLADVSQARNASATALDRETGYRTFRYTFPEAGEYTVGFGVVNEANAFLDSALLVDHLLVDGIGAIEDTFNGLIDTSVEDALAGVGSSLWWRQRFQVADAAAVESLELRARYDDGLAVFLNGQRIVSSNVPETLAWNAFATTDRDDARASRDELFRIDPDQLVQGENLLAVQTLKSAADDINLLLSVEMTAFGQIVDSPVYLTAPTPSAANLTDSFGVAEEVQFNQPRGFYDQAFNLALSTPTVGAEIRYTLDGSVPTWDNSLAYADSILIDATQTVRAVAFHEDLQPSNPVTRSYLFVEDVLTQNRQTALARGFPDAWGESVADYDVDPRVVGQNGTDLFDGVYADTVRDDLLAIPTLSLVMDTDDLFGVKGIYSHPFERGRQWERPTSIELIYPDGRDGFQIDAGVRIQGGISRFIASKLSLRLLFKSEYGASKLEFPFFGPDAGSTFDSLSLRSSSGEHLVGIHYLRDEYARRSQLQTGNVASNGNYMHVYINGLYWGMYNPAERIDGQFAANYFGGEKSEYDVLNAGDVGDEGVSVVTGSLDAWSRMRELVQDVEDARTQEAKTEAYLKLQGLNADGTPNPGWESFLDVDNYVDYLITQVYVRNTDWPIRNYYMLRRRGPDSTGFKFYVWDAEFTLDRGTRDTISSIGRDGPGVIFQSLDTSEAFRVAFSDRVQRHFSPGGAYYVNPANRTWDPQQRDDNVPAARYADLAAEIFAPLGPETARWGDEKARKGRLLVRDAEWAQTVNRNLTSFFPNRSRDFLADLRRSEFYRDAPALSPTGGLISPGQSVEISAQVGQAYYTLDGTDPRNPDGSLSESAILYDGLFSLDSRTTVHTRSLDGIQWSAVNQVTYYTDALPATVDSLRFSEINYNPHDPFVVLGEADVDNDEFEFVEIVNVTDAAVELDGVRLAQRDNQGVEFTFGRQRLDVGQRVVVGRNRAALISRFGNDLPLANGVDSNVGGWVYQGKLGNGGETLTLLTSDGQLIQRLTYGDDAPWPAGADGGASSLEVIDLTGNLDDPANYRSSVDVGGSPGRPGTAPNTTIVINEVLANPGAARRDQIELFNASDVTVDLSGWYVSDSDNDLLRYDLPLDTVIAPGEYIVLDEQQLGFGLSGLRGDQVYLVSADGSGRPEQFVDVVRFDAMAAGVSLGRWPDGQGPLFPMEVNSLGRRNVGPLAGDAIISEVHYAPRDPDGGGRLSEEEFEFVEIYNRSPQPLDLAGWRITGDFEYLFPPETTLPAGQALIVTGFDPVTNPSLASAFELTFSVGSDVALHGAGVGTLSNHQGTVRLDQPTADPSQGERAWVLVDRVDYADQAPWPDDLHANQRSLQRVAELAFANLPSSWFGGRASPGLVDFSLGLPGDVTGDGQIDIADVDDLCSSLRNGDDRAVLDVNRDGIVDFDDFNQLITNVLRTQAGDTNLDRVFNSSDLISVFATAEYEDGIDGNSTWSEGDWNCDGDFTTDDIVATFISGGYSEASRPTLLPRTDRLDLLVASAVVDAVAADQVSASVRDDAGGAMGEVTLSPLRLPAIESRAIDQVWASKSGRDSGLVGRQPLNTSGTVDVSEMVNTSEAVDPVFRHADVGDGLADPWNE